MTLRVFGVATGMVAAALTLGACNSIEGTPTAEPGAARSLRTTTSSATSSTPAPRSTTTRPGSPTTSVPAPANASTMTCREFSGLDLSHQVAVLKALGATRNFEMVANLLTVTHCSLYPDLTIRDALSGKLPR